jgi:SAM-dependent methyltransferase
MDKIHLNHVALIGHTYNEYKQMFGMSKSDLEGKKVLDAGAGVSNYTAIANAFGIKVTAVDTIYDLPSNELEQRCKQDLARLLNEVPKLTTRYDWDYFGDLKGLEISRIKSYQLFLRDYEDNPKHYVSGSMISLPFDAFTFDVSLVSHLMFLYDELLDEDFHIKALKELLRVTKEKIIIFPLFNLEGEFSEWLQKIEDQLKALNVGYKLCDTEYPVVKGLNKRLEIYCNNSK